MTVNYFSLHVTSHHNIMLFISFITMCSIDEYTISFINLVYFTIHLNYLKYQNDMFWYGINEWKNLIINSIINLILGKISQRTDYLRSNVLRSNVLRSNDSVKRSIETIKHQIGEETKVVAKNSIEYVFSEDLGIKNKILSMVSNDSDVNKQIIDNCKNNGFVIIKSIINKLKEDEEIQKNVKKISNQCIEQLMEQKDTIIMFIKKEMDNILKDEKKKKEIMDYLKERTKYIVDESTIIDSMVDPIVIKIKQRIKEIL